MIDIFRVVINNKFLVTLTLINIFKSDLFRYPDDVLDRYWYGYKNDNLTTLRTLNTVNSRPNNDFQLPSTVMRTAITANGTLYFGWVPPDNNTQYYIYMHSALCRS